MIRPFKQQDLDRVMELWLNTNIQAHDFIDANYWRSNFDSVREAIPKSTVYVYEEQGTIQGFIGQTDDYIAGIFVAPEFQSNGIGKMLLDQAKQGHDTLSLQVYQKNACALGFYLHEGFVVHREEFDQKTGEIELFMCWTK